LLATRRLTAAALATLIALAGITAQVSPATATDPVVTPAPTTAPDVSPLPTADPAVTPAPSVAPAVVPTALAVVVVPRPTRTEILAARLRLVVRIAISKIHARYVWGATGPNAFDCSGLVRYAYRKAGMSAHLGGGNSSMAMLMWGRIHHLTSRVHPQIGDVAVYGNGRHVGIYIGGGRIISALNPRQGVKITGLYALTGRFTTFIHTGR